MCEICRMVPCHPRCPNAEEDKGVTKCVKCHEWIFADEKTYDTGFGLVCMECLKAMDVYELFDLLDVKFTRAS